MHNKHYESKKVKTTYILERREYIIIFLDYEVSTKQKLKLTTFERKLVAQICVFIDYLVYSLEAVFLLSSLIIFYMLLFSLDCCSLL